MNTPIKDINLENDKDVVLFLIETKGNCRLLNDLICSECPLGPKDCMKDNITYTLAIKYALEHKFITEEKGFELLL